MPYFKWVGVDITGRTKKGKCVGYSSKDITATFLKQGIALLQVKLIYTPSFLWPIDFQKKSNLFQQKAKLLQAGLLLPKILEVVAQQSSHPFIHDALIAIRNDIQQGISFDKALIKYNLLSDHIAQIMVTAGYESGDLVSALENVSIYFHKKHTFRKNMLRALAIPLLTLIFFMGISFFIFIFIIPRFAEMFSSLQQELPTLTQTMISLSEFINSSSMMYIILFLAASLLVIYHYSFTDHGKKIRNAIIDSLPFIHTIMWRYYISQSFQALSLLINSGVSLPVALKIVSDSISYDNLKKQLQSLHDEVSSGQLLSNAMAKTFLFFPEVIALVSVGEESGTIGNSLKQVGLLYNEKVEEGLQRFVFFIQPVAILILGLLVTLLIFAIYLPIMQLSYVI